MASRKIGHFTVVYSVTRPMNDSEASSDLHRPHCFYNGNRVVVMLTSLHLHKKSKEVCIKTRSPAAFLPAISKVTKNCKMVYCKQNTERLLAPRMHLHYRLHGNLCFINRSLSRQCSSSTSAIIDTLLFPSQLCITLFIIRTSQQ